MNTQSKVIAGYKHPDKVRELANTILGKTDPNGSWWLLNRGKQNEMLFFSIRNSTTGRLNWSYVCDDEDYPHRTSIDPTHSFSDMLETDDLYEAYLNTITTMEYLCSAEEFYTIVGNAFGTRDQVYTTFPLDAKVGDLVIDGEDPLILLDTLQPEPYTDDEIEEYDQVYSNWFRTLADIHDQYPEDFLETGVSFHQYNEENIGYVKQTGYRREQFSKASLWANIMDQHIGFFDTSSYGGACNAVLAVKNVKAIHEGTMNIANTIYIDHNFIKGIIDNKSNGLHIQLVRMNTAEKSLYTKLRNHHQGRTITTRKSDMVVLAY